VLMVITIVAIVGQHADDHHDQQHHEHHGAQTVACMVRLTLWTVAVETPVAAATARIE
jgi:hypothetical protein